MKQVSRCQVSRFQSPRFDALDKVVVSSIEQFGDDRHFAYAVAQPFSVT